LSSRADASRGQHADIEDICSYIKLAEFCRRTKLIESLAGIELLDGSQYLHRRCVGDEKVKAVSHPTKKRIPQKTRTRIARLSLQSSNDWMTVARLIKYSN
jgi:hypothetical protein